MSTIRAAHLCPNNRGFFTRIHYRVDLCTLLLLASCFLPSTAAAADAVAPDFRTEVNEVQLEMVATDVTGQPVANLAPEDLKVVEDGAPVRGFGLSRTHDLPLRATLIYDTSESNQNSWRQMQTPVMRFLQSALDGQDQLWIAAFDSRVQFSRRIQGSEQVIQALNAKRDTFSATAFNDSLLQLLRSQPTEDASQRRSAMIVFSDGEDNYSLHSFRDVIAAAQRAKVAVYWRPRLRGSQCPRPGEDAYNDSTRTAVGLRSVLFGAVHSQQQRIPKCQRHSKP